MNESYLKEYAVNLARLNAMKVKVKYLCKKYYDEGHRLPECYAKIAEDLTQMFPEAFDNEGERSE